MATVAQNLLVVNDTNAHLRAWGAAMNANLIAAGLVQAADTGQINWTTVVVPANNTTFGYEIYKLNDSLQATKPIFIKIEYINGSPYNAGNQPGFWITIGTSTDGAGTINSAIQTSRQQLGSYGATSTAAVPCIWAGDGSYIMFLLGYTNGGNGGNYTPYAMMVLDRTRDATGAITGDGFWAIRSSFSDLGYSANGFAAAAVNVTHGSTNNPTCSWTEVFALFDRAQVSARNNYSVAMAPGDTWGTGADGVDVTTYPLLIQSGKQTFEHAMLVGFNNDFTQATPISTTVLGAVHTYLPIKFTPTGLANHCMLLRWE